MSDAEAIAGLSPMAAMAKPQASGFRWIFLIVVDRPGGVLVSMVGDFMVFGVYRACCRAVSLIRNHGQLTTDNSSLLLAAFVLWVEDLLPLVKRKGNIAPTRGHRQPQKRVTNG